MIHNTSPCYHDRSLRTVVAWTDEGQPLVIDHHLGELVQVSGQITDEPQIVQIIPATGWQVTYNPGTDSEHTDGHTRFVLLRGGVFLPPGGSEWLVARGARPNDFHAKYLLLADGLDRSATISFRTIAP